MTEDREGTPQAGGSMPDFVWATDAPSSVAGDAPQPAATAVLTAPAGPSRRHGTATLAALALLGGLAGGAVSGRALTDPTPEAVAATVARGTTSTTTTTAASLTSGTPQSAAAAISPSVVTLAVTGPSGSGTGSGVILSEDGYIVTNDHVVGGAGGGGSVTVELADGTDLDATVVGTDPTSDLAVVRVASADGLVAATFADSDALRVGQSVLAVGAPLGLSSTVTQGIVSTLHRPVRTGDASSQSVIDAVQTDAAINPGNSGGALVDLSGQVVGIPSAIATTSGSSGSIGVGFAIPSNDAAEIADEIIADGRATHAQMGVSVASSDGTASTGAVLAAVTPGGPADAAGLRGDDVVTRVGEREVTDADALIVAVRSHDPGDEVEVTYLRDGRSATVTVTLDQAAQA